MTTTAFVSATQAQPDGDDVIVRGTATDAAGNRLASLADVEQRIIDPALKDTLVGNRHVSAVADGSGDGTLSYDDATGTTWTARYSAYPADIDQLLLAGQTRIMSWQQFTVDRQGLTIFEVGEAGGPGMGGCPGAADYAVVGASPSAINLANKSGGLTLSGTAKDTTAVQVTLTGGAGSRSVPAALTGTGAHQTWTAQFTEAHIDALGPATETLIASASYTTTASTVGAVELPVLEDVSPPDMPNATPGSAVYATVQAVSLSNPVEKGLAIHYTTDGTKPHADDPRYAGQFDVVASTTLRAVAVDAAGNESAQRVEVYELAVPPPAAPTLTLSVASDSGASGDGVTNDSTPTFEGQAPDGTTVSLRADGVQIGTAAVSSGAWSITATTRPDGTASYDAVATDSGGRTSTASAPLSLTVDTAAPSVVIDPTRLPAVNSRDPQLHFTVSEAAAAECSMTTGTASFSACTSPASYTGLADGRYAFSARATEAAGNVGPASYGYTLDATAPAVTAPAVSMVSGSTVSPTGVPVRVIWSGGDGGTGISSFELRRTVGGTVTVQALSATTTSQSLSLEPGSRNLFEVRATDGAGNTSQWATLGAFTMKGDDQEANPGITYGGAWSLANQAGSYGDSVRHASISGTVTYPFTGSTVAWVSTLGPDRGRADVYLDGVRVAQNVELYARSTAAARVLYVDNAVANPAAQHTLEIRVLGTKLGKSKGTRVDADAFLSTPAAPS